MAGGEGYSQRARRATRPGVRLFALIGVVLGLAALQIGLTPHPLLGARVSMGQARSLQPSETPVFISTSAAALVFTSTTVVMSPAPTVAASANVAIRPSPSQPPAHIPSPSATPRPTATPTRSKPATATFTPTSAATPTATPTRELHLATIDYFVADRSAAYPGDRVALSWDLHDAREAYLLHDAQEEGVVAPGGKVFTLTDTTAFTLSARTDDGETREGLVVTALPVPTPDGVHRTAEVPILMYHYISKPPKGADVYRLDLSVTPENFEAQLAWLSNHGYQTITLRDLVFHLTAGRALPEKPVILTFDDGYRDNYANAFPLLKEYGYTGTFFILTRPIDDGDPNYLTWDMVTEMHQAGMQMQPHGCRHYDLKGKSVDLLVYEIVGPKEAIEGRTGETVRFFSYPAGSYDQQTLEVLESAHFWAAVTTIQGTTQSSDALLELQRLRVRGGTTLGGFTQLLDP
jgi:peptidoglycan/xylan/chitin deacetylase (PgdA/CDA1 family)